MMIRTSQPTYGSSTLGVLTDHLSVRQYWPDWYNRWLILSVCAWALVLSHWDNYLSTLPVPRTKPAGSFPLQHRWLYVWHINWIIRTFLLLISQLWSDPSSLRITQSLKFNSKPLVRLLISLIGKWPLTSRCRPWILLHSTSQEKLIYQRATVYLNKLSVTDIQSVAVQKW